MMGQVDQEQKMRRRPRPEPHAGFQSQGGLAALNGDKTPAELAQQYDAPNQITQ